MFYNFFTSKTLKNGPNGRFLAVFGSGMAPVDLGDLIYVLEFIGIDFGSFLDTFIF